MNTGYIYRETITHRGTGQPLDGYLSTRYRHATLPQWREHILAGRVLL
ncbi:MAG: RNA pseudouridine synthase, partial [Oligoflexia bacterium]|nr:RNA pseudouridine synthase [Oligoflexia bacterium]